MKYTTISFPGLGLEMNPKSFLELGPLTIHYYGVIIAVGLILAAIYGLHRSKEFGLKQDDILDGVLAVVPFAIICARLYYCVFSWDSYKDDPISMLFIWEGGLAIYGGVIGAAMGVIVFCKIKKISLPATLDLVALGFLIGQAIGRWGNFFNREAFGEETQVFWKMGLYNAARGVTEYYHPTFLYESVWNALGFVVLHFMSKHRQYDGQIALGYVVWYGAGRAIIEGLRTDSLYWGSFRVSQVLAAVSCLAAVGVLVWQFFKTHEKSALYVNRVTLPEGEEKETENEE